MIDNGDTKYLRRFRAAISTFGADGPVLRKLAMLIDDLADPPRVGACALGSDLPLSIESLPAARMVTACWPAGCASADVVFVLHTEPLTSRVRDRLTAGPSLFVPVTGVDQIPAKWSKLPPALIVLARARHVRGQLLALASSYPSANLSCLISAIGQDICELEGKFAAEKTPKVAVIGPDAKTREVVAIELSMFAITDSPSIEVDVVVAVAPPEGWQSSHLDVVCKAFELVGRIVLTSPLPTGALDQAILADADLEKAVRTALAEVAQSSLPSPNFNKWEVAAERIERSHSLQRAHMEDTDPIAACRAYGVNPTMQWNASFAMELLVITALLTIGLSRVFSGVPLALIVALLVLARAYVKHAQLQKNWARGQLRKLHFDRSLRKQSSPAVWVRRQLANGGNGK